MFLFQEVLSLNLNTKVRDPDPHQAGKVKSGSHETTIYLKEKHILTEFLLREKQKSSLNMK